MEELSRVLAGLVGWAPTDRILECSGLIVAAILISAVAKQRTYTGDWATMPPSFVIEFATLLLLGPQVTILVVIAGTLTQARVDPRRSRLRHRLLHAATLIVATQAAGFAHESLGGTRGGFAWPWQGAPIAAAVIAYCVIQCASAEIILPLFARQPITRSWPQSLLRGSASYFIGASLAVGLIEVIDHRMWNVLPVVALPLYFLYQAYAAHVNRLEHEGRLREVIESLDHGMSVVDDQGSASEPWAT